MKANVFLSCGQNKNSDELSIAKKVAQRIREIGFECYIAVTEQSLKGLRENIFPQLESTDYLVFIDFKREELKTVSSEPLHRGSLFSHQELAIASFLEIPALILQERGVKPLDGMLGAMQANASPFADREQLPNVVAGLLSSKVHSGEWHNQTRNQLTLEVAPQSPDGYWPDKSVRRHFHISVVNHNRRKAALNCFAYLDSIVDLNIGAEIGLQTVEFKWAGNEFPSVRVGPNAFRKFDAFWFKHQNPISLGFNVFTDSAEYRPEKSIRNPGRYLLRYSVASQNFALASKEFYLEFGTTLESIKFTDLIEGLSSR